MEIMPETVVATIPEALVIDQQERKECTSPAEHGTYKKLHHFITSSIILYCFYKPFG